MNKKEFIEYSATRYDIDFSTAETIIDIFAKCLQELIVDGHSVEIDEIGKFDSIPLFKQDFNHRNNIALVKTSKRKMVSFKASEQLL